MPKPPPGFELDPMETLPAGFQVDQPQPGQNQQAPAENPEQTFAQKMMDYGKELGRQLGLTGRYIEEGTAGTIGMITDPIAYGLSKIPGYSKLVGEYVPLKQAVSKGLTDLGVPNPETAAEKIVGEISTAVAGAGTGAGIAGTTAGVAQGLTSQTAGQLAAQPTQQLVGAATGAASQQAAEKAGLGPKAQIVASLLGGIVGAGGVSTAEKLAQTKLPQAVIEAEKLGTKVMTTDVLKPKTRLGETVQRFEKPQRVAQQAQRQDMAKDLIRQYGADVDAESNATFLGKMFDEFKKKREFKVDKYNKLKTDVINKLDDQGAMPVDKTITKIDEQIAEIRKFDDQNPLIEFYENFKSKLQNKSIKNIEELRKDLGDNIDQASKNPTNPINKKRGDQIAKKVYASLKEDMGDFIKAKGESKDFNKWQAGNKKLSDMMKDFEIGALKRTLDSGEATPETIKTMLISDKPSISQALYKGLTPKGKMHARTALIQEALYRASKGNIDELSADIFKNKLRDLQRNTNIFFQGEDRKAINGLYKALKLTEDANKIVAGPPTGALNVPILTSILGAVGAGGGAAAGGPITAMAGAAALPMSISGYSRVFNSRPVRNILIKLATMPKGSPEEARLVKRLWTTMQDQFPNQQEQPAP